MGKISLETDARVRAAANDQCGYCRLPQRIHASRLEIEHIWPKAEGGTDDEENLWLACRDCNLFKSSKTHAADPDTGEKVRLFNPRNDDWHEHFEFAGGGVLIIGKTDVGRATVESLSLNNMHVVTVRREWVKVGWYPPGDQAFS